MDHLPRETEDYIKQSIDHSLGLAIPSTTLQLKLQNSEDDRRRLQDVVFLLQARLGESQKRVDQYRAEAIMNAQGLKKCVEEKEAIVAEYRDLQAHCSRLEKECTLYQRDLDKVMESFDEMAKENEELQARQQDDSAISALAAEVDSLKKDKENLKINLLRAEEEVKVLFEENRLLDEKNKRLVKQLNRERCQQSESKTSSCKSSAKGKRKSSLGDNSATGQALDFNGSGSPRPPLSPLHQNSPDSIRTYKKQLFAT
ncbi:uncharacterized protein M6B38_147225 [Iris pallida]|uniref:Uncharacterized protein n=1 Tax=Iris pallida TaxID=29817 RepID=A0AAX6F8G4_IRIPA|nr:uncharacterized protein M6B38_147225 [Iris pallida]